MLSSKAYKSFQKVHAEIKESRFPYQLSDTEETIWNTFALVYKLNGHYGFLLCIDIVTGEVSYNRLDIHTKTLADFEAAHADLFKSFME